MSDILVELHGRALWVTLNRPNVRNALSRAVNLRLQELSDEIANRDDVHAVVITGAGDKAFCAGADLKERQGVDANDAGPYINAISGAIASIGELRKPTIAAMNGSAYGGGLELALACDFRILVEGAELGLTEVRLGIIPGAGGTQRLPRIIGESRAKEMIMLGKRVTAARALEIGLVHQVVPAAGLRAAIDAWVGELDKCAPVSVQLAKQAMERGSSMTLDEGLQIERECYDHALYTEDRNEGLAAFAENRLPQWKGR